MCASTSKNHKCFGTTTVGERGQIVIPAEARKSMELKAGDKLIVIGGEGNHPLVLIKADGLAETIAHLTEKVNFLKEMKGKLGVDEE
jgi:AbrB family looped-hinge helix DNA binding protein